MILSKKGGLCMIEKMPNLPDNVLGFTASGTITAADYKSVMIPAVEAMFSRLGKVRFLYHLGKEFAGFDAGAVWADAKLGLKHFTDWERMALVTDVEWIRTAFKVFGFVMPGEIRVFKNRELVEAIRWISA
jgi:hypothetical protein